MRRITITLVFIALMSLAIAKTFADSSVPPVDGILCITAGDPSTIPKPQGGPAEAGMAYSSAASNGTSPDQTYYQVYITLPDTHSLAANILNYTIQNTGSYDIVLDYYVTNPSYKWACAVALPSFSAYPYSSVQGNSIAASVTYPSNDYLASYWSNLTWSAQNLWVWRVEIKFTVVSTPAVIMLYFGFNQMWTDQNGDGKIGITDIAIVAKHYGTIYQDGDTHINDPWNVVHDNVVNLVDIAAVVHEFGRTLPP
jgi:hypothetical protein